MNIQALKTELAAGHPVTGPYSADHAQAAAQLNAKNRAVLWPLPMRSVLRWAARHDGVFALEQAASSGAPGKRKLAKAALEMIRSPHVTELDLTDAEISGMLAALVAEGVFTAAQRDDLVALATVTISRAEELGLGTVNAQHVKEARAA